MQVTTITRLMFDNAKRRYRQGYEEVSRALDHLLKDALEDLKLGGDDQAFMLATTTAVALRTTIGNAHHLLSVVLAWAQEPDAVEEAPAVETVSCSECAGRFPMDEVRRVRFLYAEGEVLLCGTCLEKARADGREVSEVGTVAPERPQPPAEDADDKLPEEPVAPDFTPPVDADIGAGLSPRPRATEDGRPCEDGEKPGEGENA